MWSLLSEISGITRSKNLGVLIHLVFIFIDLFYLSTVSQTASLVWGLVWGLTVRLSFRVQKKNRSLSRAFILKVPPFVAAENVNLQLLQSLRELNQEQKKKKTNPSSSPQPQGRRNFAEPLMVQSRTADDRGAREVVNIRARAVKGGAAPQPWRDLLSGKRTCPSHWRQAAAARPGADGREEDGRKRNTSVLITGTTRFIKSIIRRRYLAAIRNQSRHFDHVWRNPRTFFLRPRASMMMIVTKMIIIIVINVSITQSHIDTWPAVPKCNHSPDSFVSSVA